MGFLGRSSFAYAMFGAPFFVRPRGMLLGTVIPEVDYQPVKIVAAAPLIATFQYFSKRQKRRNRHK
jgi:hypothetical protein